MFCLVHDFTFLMTDTKIKEQVPFESWEKKLMSARLSVKFVMLPVQSITLANWFACMPACTSAITRVSLTSLDRQILIITCLIYFAAQDMSFSGFWSSTFEDMTWSSHIFFGFTDCLSLPPFPKMNFVLTLNIYNFLTINQKAIKVYIIGKPHARCAELSKT